MRNMLAIKKDFLKAKSCHSIIFWDQNKLWETECVYLCFWSCLGSVPNAENRLLMSWLSRHIKLLVNEFLALACFQLSPSTAYAGKHSLDPLVHHSFSHIFLLFVGWEFLKDGMASPKCQLADQLVMVSSLAETREDRQVKKCQDPLCLPGTQEKGSCLLCRAEVASSRMWRG